MATVGEMSAMLDDALATLDALIKSRRKMSDLEAPTWPGLIYAARAYRTLI
jgi:hypothetical protein